MPEVFTILIDNREKRPLSFPSVLTVLSRKHLPHQRVTTTVRIATKAVRLETADYVLDEPGVLYTLEGIRRPRCIVERKAALDEIAANCLDPRKRLLFSAQLSRLRAGWDSPMLLFEGGLATALTPTADNPHPGLAVDALLDLTREHGVPVVPLGSPASPRQRALTAEWVLRYLISGALSHAHPDPLRQDDAQC